MLASPSIGQRLICYAFGALLWSLVPYPVRADDASKSKEISEVEKQIQELNKKLADLKKKEQEEGKGIPSDWFKSS